MKFLFNIFRKKSRLKQNGIFYDKCEKIIGFEPGNIDFYLRAFTHRSVNRTDAQGYPINYERLEFLGDAILGSVVAVHLYRSSPQGDEGYLTKMRSKIVSRNNLNKVGKKLRLIELVSSKVNKQQFGENIYGNILEALIGAVYLDKGFDFCEQYIHLNILSHIENIETLEQKITSYKSLFIEYCQKEKKTFRFETFEDDTNEHLKHFAVRLHYGEKIIARARATSKKKAEEKAAQRAYFALQHKMRPYIK